MRSLEALEDGDQILAVQILRGAEETFPVCDPLGTRRHCPVCGWGPGWPGEIADHVDVVHPWLEELRQAA